MSDSNFKIQKFSGEKRDWQLLSELFKAKMITKDLLDVIKMEPLKMPDKDFSEDNQEQKELVEKKNEHT